MTRFLKRLELHGFKSFAHKTSIEFLDGITIVVGPNGCGKSNVLDSIRWVLGETSAKSLRGSSMGDVVFRGSASLKPAHFAQVNLIVNNEAGLLRLDHSEVMVTRRRFSNGDSEYQINKQKGRMRDVQELFLDTGLGADNYSIIEQNQIGAITGAKPAERRELFEEAAGISRYKARREETMRKLVRTEEDLLRLYDIISEVERQCNSLYRQAKKAERHRRYRRRLNRLQKRLLVTRGRLLSGRLVEVDGRLLEARAAFEEASAKLASAEARRAESAQLIEEYQGSLQQLQQERYDAQELINREQRRIEGARQTAGSLDEREEMVEKQLAAARSREQVLRRTLAAAEADLARETAALREKSAGAEEAARRLDALRREHESSSADVNRLRRELETERTKRSKVEQDRALSEQLVERLRGEIASHEETMRTLREEAAESEAHAEAARAEHARLRERIDDLTRRHGELSARIRDREAEKSGLAKELDGATRAHNQAASRLEALEELEARYEGFYRGVQVVMRAAADGHLRGLIGVLTNLVTVPAEYEVALEVAFGASLQDIVAESEKDAQAAIRYLKEKRQGRATFLPLDLLSANTRLDALRPLIGRPGVVGFARELVRFDRRIDKAIDRRLGATIIVEDLPVAVELQKQGLRNRYVSLEGELVDPSGVLTGGSHKSQGFLSRSRDIREMRDQVAVLDQKRQRLQEELASATDELSQAHAEAAAIQAELHEQQVAESRAERDQQAGEERAKERRNQLAAAEARHLQQRHDLGKHEERIGMCAEGLGTLNQVIATLEARIDEVEAATGERTGLLERLGEEAAAARAALSGLRERVNALDHRREDLQDQIQATVAEIATRVEEKGMIDGQRGGVDEEITGAEARLAEHVRQRDRVEAAISRLTQENEERLRKAREGLAQVQALTRDRNQCQNTLHEVELEATDLRSQITVIEQEAEDEFACTLAELEAGLGADQEGEATAVVAMDGSSDDEEETPEDLTKVFARDDEVTDLPALRALVNELREKLTRMGGVNETAIDEYNEQKERRDFLVAQRDDLTAAKDQLAETIRTLDETTTRLFSEAYTRIRENFQANFRRLFEGGEGDLRLVEDENSPEPGIEIYAQPPGKRIGGSIQLMSGGEKAMTAIALMLALFQFRPSPVCVLDEVDAPLDDENCRRFCRAIREFSRTTQFLVITHNKITMALADTIYGVTMQEPGISKLVSVRFDEVEDSGLLESTG